MKVDALLRQECLAGRVRQGGRFTATCIASHGFGELTGQSLPAAIDAPDRCE